MCYQPCKNAGKRDMLLAANETISSFLFLFLSLDFPSIILPLLPLVKGSFQKIFLWSNLFGAAGAPLLLFWDVINTIGAQGLLVIKCHVRY